VGGHGQEAAEPSRRRAPDNPKAGGKLESDWLAFGDYDIVAICEMPNNVSAAAFAMVGVSWAKHSKSGGEQHA
jgi:uncharacterized protein with GYD domain